MTGDSDAFGTGLAVQLVVFTFKMVYPVYYRGKKQYIVEQFSDGFTNRYLLNNGEKVNEKDLFFHLACQCQSPLPQGEGLVST